MSKTIDFFKTEQDLINFALLWEINNPRSKPMTLGGETVYRLMVTDAEYRKYKIKKYGNNYKKE